MKGQEKEKIPSQNKILTKKEQWTVTMQTSWFQPQQNTAKIGLSFFQHLLFEQKE